MNATENKNRPFKRRLEALATVGALALSLGAAATLLAPATTISPALAQATQVQTLPGSFADVVDRVKSSVVSVKVLQQVDPRQTTMQDDDEDEDSPSARPYNRPFPRFGEPEFRRGFPGDRDTPRFDPRNPRANPQYRGQAQGSGFFISADGYLVTNHHVVRGAGKIQITTENGQTYDAKLIGSDPRTDLALLKVDGKTDFPFATLSATPPRVGDWVIAVGNPFGLGGTVTAGIVSARSREIGAGPYDFIQIDAPVNRGNSGGPTFNVLGQVIGVNTAIYSPSGGSVGIAFAIPAETVKQVIDSLRTDGTVTRGWIGVQIQPVTPELAEVLKLPKPEGAIVADTDGDGPAKRAGIVSGDVIVAVGGEPVKNASDLARRIGRLQPGSTTKLTVVSDGKTRDVEITLGRLGGPKSASPRGDNPQISPADAPRIGLTLAPAAGRLGPDTPGVVITEIDPNGPAADRGLKVNDVIVEIERQTVSTPAEVRQILARARAEGKKSVLLRLLDQQRSRLVAIPIAAG